MVTLHKRPAHELIQLPIIWEGVNDEDVHPENIADHKHEDLAFESWLAWLVTTNEYSKHTTERTAEEGEEVEDGFCYAVPARETKGEHFCGDEPNLNGLE